MSTENSSSKLEQLVHQRIIADNGLERLKEPKYPHKPAAFISEQQLEAYEAHLRTYNELKEVFDGQMKPLIEKRDQANLRIRTLMRYDRTLRVYFDGQYYAVYLLKNTNKADEVIITYWKDYCKNRNIDQNTGEVIEPEGEAQNGTETGPGYIQTIYKENPVGGVSAGKLAERVREIQRTEPKFPTIYEEIGKFPSKDAFDAFKYAVNMNRPEFPSDRFASVEMVSPVHPDYAASNEAEGEERKRVIDLTVKMLADADSVYRQYFNVRFDYQMPHNDMIIRIAQLISDNTYITQ